MSYIVNAEDMIFVEDSSMTNTFHESDISSVYKQHVIFSEFTVANSHSRNSSKQNATNSFSHDNQYHLCYRSCRWEISAEHVLSCSYLNCPRRLHLVPAFRQRSDKKDSIKHSQFVQFPLLVWWLLNFLFTWRVRWAKSIYLLDWIRLLHVTVKLLDSVDSCRLNMV